MIIAFAAASFISAPEICGKVYDNYVHDHVMDITEKAVSEAERRAEEEIINALNDGMDSLIDEKLGGSDFLKETFHGITGTKMDDIKSSIRELADFLDIDVASLLTIPQISGKINEAADLYCQTAADRINDKLPLGIKVKADSVREIMTDNDAIMAIVYDMLGINSTTSPSDGVAVYLEKKVIRPIFIRFIGIIIWAVVFAAVNAVLRIIISIIMIIAKAPPIKACDSALGAAAGCAAGIAVIIVCSTLIFLAVNFTGGMSFMNEDIFSKTMIFGRIYDIIAGFDMIA